jgi:hypothetical protein
MDRFTDAAIWRIDAIIPIPGKAKELLNLNSEFPENNI